MYIYSLPMDYGLYYMYFILILYIYIYIYIYIYNLTTRHLRLVIFRFLQIFYELQLQLFWNLKFHAVLLTVFSQLTLTLNCYSAMESSWRHLISLMLKWKTHPSPMLTQHTRERSRKPSSPQVQDGAGTLAWPPSMLKHKTVAYFPLPR